MTHPDAKVGVTAHPPDAKEGTTFDQIPFHVEAEQRPSLDSFVVVERADTSDTLHYGRIAAGVEHNPDSDAAMQQAAHAYRIDMGDVRPGDHDPRVTRVMFVDLLGELFFEDDDLNVRQPRALPQTGQGVYVVDGRRLPSLLDVPEVRDDSDEGFVIGEMHSGGESAPFALSRETIARHTAILGRTGVGKTYTAHVLVEELVKEDVPIIMFDVMDDAGPMTEDLGGKTVRPGENLTIPYSLIGFSALEEFISYTEAQRDLAETAYGEIHGEALEQLREDGEVNIPIDRLTEEIQDYGDNTGSQATGRAINKTEWGHRLSPLGEKMDNWAEMMIENPIINIDIGKLGENERALVIGAVGRMLQQLRRREEVPPFVLVVDEAHKYVPSSAERSPAGRVMRDFVQTARHDAIGTVLITQSPSTLDDVALRTANTHIVMALDSSEMSAVKGLFGDLSDDTLARVPKLEKGRAMVASARDLMRHTVPVDIRERDTREGADTPDLVDLSREWVESYLRDQDTSFQQQFD